MDQLDPEDAREVLIRLWDALDGKDVGTWTAIDAARACALPFYPDHRLVEARLVKDGACEGIISFVDGRGEISILDGKSHPMHVLNASVPLLVDTEERAIEYMRFFCANCHSDDGPFSIVTTPHELFFAPATPAAIRERAASYATPVRANPALLEAPQEDTPHPLWGFTGVVCYSNALFEANITVGKGGRIDMIDDWPIVSGMTVTAERMEGVVRKIRTIEGDDATVRFEADVNALNHAADEIAADQSGAAESGFRQVEASLARLGLDALPRYETEFRPYVQLLLARGRYADAAGWARRSLAALPRGVSEAREATAVARTVLASAAAGAGRDDAQALCDDAVEAARLADDNALLAQAWLAQAHAANTRGDMAAAREALAGIERLDPPPPPRTRRGALRLHAALLIAQADHDGAAALLARAAELKAGNENEIDLEGMILTALVSGGSGESGDSGDLAVAVDALSDESQREVDNVAWGSLDWLRPFLSAEIADALDAGRAHYDRERDAFVTATYGSSGAIS
jgi:tetratricopeptide (TPR) repeat protein